MKKISISLVVAIMATTLCAPVAAQQQQQLPQGCSSTVGYSSTTGVKCDSLTVMVEATVTVPVTRVETKTTPGGSKKIKVTVKDENCKDKEIEKTVKWGSKTVIIGTKTTDTPMSVKVNVPVVRGLDGTGCSVRDNKNGTHTVTCGASSTVIHDGENGSSCSVTDNGNGSKTLACTDGTSVIVKDGVDGKNGFCSGKGCKIAAVTVVGGLIFCALSGKCKIGGKSVVAGGVGVITNPPRVRSF